MFSDRKSGIGPVCFNKRMLGFDESSRVVGAGGAGSGASGVKSAEGAAAAAAEGEAVSGVRLSGGRAYVSGSH